MLQTKIAWLAGIIDGEGYIGIYRATRKYRNGNVVVLPTPCITIVNSSQNLLVECEKIMSELGIITYGLKESRNGAKRLVKRIALRNQKSMLTLLDAVIPYLIAKKEQALLLKEFLEKFYGKPGYLEERMTYFFKLQELKQEDQLTP